MGDLKTDGRGSHPNSRANLVRPEKQPRRLCAYCHARLVSRARAKYCSRSCTKAARATCPVRWACRYCGQEHFDTTRPDRRNYCDKSCASSALAPLKKEAQRKAALKMHAANKAKYVASIRQWLLGQIGRLPETLTRQETLKLIASLYGPIFMRGYCTGYTKAERKRGPTNYWRRREDVA